MESYQLWWEDGSWIKRNYHTTKDGLAKLPDPIHNPSHYTMNTIQPIDIIEDYNLGPHEANVIKYVLRAPYKGMELKDLKKARWYLDRKIQLLEKDDASI